MKRTKKSRKPDPSVMPHQDGIAVLLISSDEGEKPKPVFTVRYAPFALVLQKMVKTRKELLGKLQAKEITQDSFRSQMEKSFWFLVHRCCDEVVPDQSLCAKMMRNCCRLLCDFDNEYILKISNGCKGVLDRALCVISDTKRIGDVLLLPVPEDFSPRMQLACLRDS